MYSKAVILFPYLPKMSGLGSINTLILKMKALELLPGITVTVSINQFELAPQQKKRYYSVSQ